MKEIAKLGIILLIITSISAVVLGFTNNVTLPAIEKQNELANIEARKQVLPEAKDFKPFEENIDSSMVIEVYKGLDGSDIVGYTIKTAPKGYAGVVEVMIGIGTDGTIHGVSIGNHAETPGLGAKAANEEFKGQYKGKSVDKNIEVIKNPGPKENEIVAISGATITSKAVTDGVNEAMRVYNEILK
ncbi:RnfABCDGE type electron transport complex subunit G [Tepidibacter formicigenes]|jgi:electron transport complex protein RnfG|uniref:Ion-translocating oxidoreductase complex subunit G n=1 Tax=Tepidibacter formicigenes DSM 15518 TaxID=1123349 RepID=A0A1M6K2A7_9FIRM|nr:RnfABCDGE type electron transport complex subunit G [Tepidibacter formicigenes]SHJ52992.1 electron transport complex protein RnfG [Tepidibacter formicigenes DSM 15518]